MAFVQTGNIRDSVFPLALVQEDAGHLALTGFLGTAFLIGSRGVALTAGHVLPAVDSASHVAGLFVDTDSTWRAFPLKGFEHHPSEDVAVLALEGGPWRSFLRLTNEHAGQTLHYRLFGYPEDVASEITVKNRVALRPDLIYSEGYVRRRLSMALPTNRGTQFFELSAPAGRGCSGSPVMKIDQLPAPAWTVIGVYVGEKINDRDASVGFAVRAEAFCDWEPNLVENSILRESQAISPVS